MNWLGVGLWRVLGIFLVCVNRCVGRLVGQSVQFAYAQRWDTIASHYRNLTPSLPPLHFLFFCQEIEELFGHYFDLVIINDDYEKSYKALTRKVEELNKEPQWVPIEWLNHTAIRWYDGKTKTKNKTNKLTDKRENSNSRLNSWGLFKFWKMFLRVFDLNSWFFFSLLSRPFVFMISWKVFRLLCSRWRFFVRRNTCFVPFLKTSF